MFQSTKVTVTAAAALVSVLLGGVYGFAATGCSKKPEAKASPLPKIGQITMTAWHANVRIAGKPYESLYVFYSDGTFFDQETNTETKAVTESEGKYTYANGKVSIDGTKSEARENGTITWVNPNEFRYLITSHSDKEQVGLETTFRRGDLPKPPKPPEPVETEQPEILTRMSAGRIERIIHSFREVENFEELADGTYKFDVDGLKILLANKGQTLQMAAAFSGEVTVSRINEWNRTMPFSRAYLSMDSEPRLAADLDLSGGVMEDNVKEWMRTFVLSLNTFKRHLEE